MVHVKVTLRACLVSGRVGAWFKSVLVPLTLSDVNVQRATWLVMAGTGN